MQTRRWDHSLVFYCLPKPDISEIISRYLLAAFALRIHPIHAQPLRRVIFLSLGVFIDFFFIVIVFTEFSTGHFLTAQ